MQDKTSYGEYIEALYLLSWLDYIKNQVYSYLLNIGSSYAFFIACLKNLIKY